MIEYTKGDSKMSKEDHTISFSIEDMVFEYDEAKNQANIKKHHVSFKAAARVFFDRNRIELYGQLPRTQRYVACDSPVVRCNNSYILSV